MRKLIFIIPLLILIIFISGCVEKQGYDGLSLEVATGYKAELLFKPPLANPSDIVRDTDGNLYIAQTDRNSIVKVAPDGSYEEYVTLPANPQAVLLTPEGELLAGTVDDKIYKVTKDKEVKEWVKVPAFRIAMDAAGNVYSTKYLSGKIYKTTPLAVTSVFMDGFVSLSDIEFDSKENLYVTDSGVGKVYKIVGNEKAVVAEGFIINDPFSIAFDKNDQMYSTDNVYGISKVNNGNVTSLYSAGSVVEAASDLVIDENGTIYVASSPKGGLFKIPADGKIRMLISGFNSRGMAILNDEIYISDDNVYPPENGRILRMNDRKTIAGGFYKIQDIVTDGTYFYVLSLDKTDEENNNIWQVSIDGSRILLAVIHKKESYSALSGPASLGYDQTTNEVLVFLGGSNELMRVKQNGTVYTQDNIRFRDFGFTANMAVDKEGTLYILVDYASNFNVGPISRDLIIVKNGKQTTFNLDVDRGAVEDDIAVNSKGEIYSLLMGGLEDLFRLVKIENGQIIPIVRSLPVDPLALDIDSSDNLYVNSGAGIIKVSKS
jgi:sugar lactone lactonase YvrE